MAEEAERYAFIADWFDTTASMTRKYALVFFPKDGSVELIDLKSKKVFLKRTKAEGITLDSLYIGASVNIFSRQLKIVDFGDEFTRRVVGNKQERTLVIIKPADLSSAGGIIDQFAGKGLVLANARLGFIAPTDAEELIGSQDGTVAQLTEGPVLALELLGVEAVSLTGGSGSASARSRFSSYASPDATTAARQLQLVFGQNSIVQPSPLFKNSTLCLIKPHIVASGAAGKVLDAILKNGFQLGAMQTFTLDNASASEFLEVYKGVVTEYPAMVAALTAGTTIALEVVGDADAQQKFREFCGPADPEIARHIRKNTLRALFGVDKVNNAVHCTDLPEDCGLELDYFFRILA